MGWLADVGGGASDGECRRTASADSRRGANGAQEHSAGGVSIDLTRRLGAPLEPVIHAAAGKVVEGIGSGDRDVGLFAIDPVAGPAGQ